jgi:hypothetical protein
MSGTVNTNTTDINSQEVIPTKERIKMLLNRLYRLFFGDDIFISHSRIDGIGYARSLARLLQKKYQFSCYADFHWTEPGENLPQFLIKKLKRSTVLVVVISKGAVNWSKNIKEEIEIFRKTKRPIFIIDLDNSYNKNEWSELNGINVVKGLTELNSSIRRPSIQVLQGVRDSFKYKTKYNQQRRSAFIAFSLITLSVLTVIITGFYTSQMVAQARQERDAANAEKELAIQDKNVEVENKNKAIEEKDIALKETSETKNNLNQTINKLEEAESDLSKTKAEKERAETETLEANKKREEFERASLEAKNEAIIAQKQTEESKIREMGNQASLMATQRDKRLLALQQAKSAVDNNRKFTRSEIFSEVQKGLIDAVVAMDFDKTIKTNGEEISFIELSPNGKFIFGEIVDLINGRRKRVIWETERSFKYIELTEPFGLDFHNEVGDIAFSGDGRWLLIITSKKIELWEIFKSGKEYRIQYKNNLNEKLLKFVSDIKVNFDGTEIAIAINGFMCDCEDVTKIFTSDHSTLRFKNDITPPSNYSITNIWGLDFSPENDLIINYAVRSTQRHLLDFVFYNETKNRVLLLYQPGDWSLGMSNAIKLDTITESGDILLERVDRGNHIFPSKFILISSKNGKIIKTFFSYFSETDFRPKSSNKTISFKYINNRILKVEYLFHNWYITGTEILPDSYVYDLLAVLNYNNGDTGDFNFLDDANSLVFHGEDKFKALITKQKDRWAQLFSNNKINWIEKAQTGFFYSYDSETSSTLYNEKIQVNSNISANKISCVKQIEKYSRPPLVLEKEYFAIAEEGDSFSVYKSSNCNQRIKQIKLDKPNKVNYLRSSYISLGKNKTLKQLLYLDDRDYVVVTWDLSYINWNDESKLTIPYRLYKLPADKTYYLAENTREINLFAFDGFGVPSVVKLKDNSFNLTNLETDSIYNYNFEKNSPGEEWHSPNLTADSVDDIVFSPSGDLVAKIDYYGRLRIWSTKNGKALITLIFPKWVTEKYSRTPSIKFSPDEERIGIIFNDGMIRFYPASLEGFYKMAQLMLGEEVDSE